MIGQSAVNPTSKPTDPNYSSVPRNGKLMGAGPKRTTSGTIKLEAGKYILLDMYLEVEAM